MRIHHPLRAVIFMTAMLTATLPAIAQDQPATTEPAAATDPAAALVVEELHAGMLEAMKNAEALGYQGRYDLLAPIISKTIDQEFMARKSIGLHWKRLSPEDQARWVETFTQLTVATYAGRFKGFNGESFETLGQDPGPRDTLMVNSVIRIPSDEDVELNYRMHETDNGWRVIDIYMNGTVSELSLRRSEYSSAIKREGFEYLVAALDEKAQSLAVDGGVAPTAKVN